MKHAMRLTTTLASAGLLFAAGCGGGTPSTKDPIVDAPLPEDAVTLSGIVTDNPIVNASVMMSVAGNDFMAGVPTGSRGDFSIRIESDDPLALVTAEAWDDVNGVRLSAVLDTFEGCQILARNGIVDDVLITNVTTAQKVLGERIAADGSIDSFDEFTEIADQIDADELLELAAALKVVIENIDGNTLPSGYADTVALARDIAAGTSTFLADIETATPGALDTARELLLTDGNATVPVRPESAAGVYLSDDFRFVYALFDNGTALADFFQDFLVPGVPSWAIDELGRINVTFYGFNRAGDSLSVLGRVGDMLHIVADFDGLGDPTGQLVASNVRKYDFGGTFDSAAVVGAWFDPATPSTQWVFEASGDGYRVDAGTLVRSDAFTWSITADGRLRVEYAEFDEVLEIVLLDAFEDGVQQVLNVSRFASQWSTLSVAGFEKAASVPGS